MRFIFSGLCILGYCLGLNSQQVGNVTRYQEPGYQRSSEYQNPSGMTNPADRVREHSSPNPCSCGCKCRAPCRCGCQSGKPCNCPQ